MSHFIINSLFFQLTCGNSNFIYSDVHICGAVDRKFTNLCCAVSNGSRFQIMRTKNQFAGVNSLRLIEHTLPSIWSHCNCKQKGRAFIYKQFKFNQTEIKPNGCRRLSRQLTQCICPRPASGLCDSGCSWRTAR